MMKSMRTVILGASGYTGAELLRLLAFHPHLEVAFAGASANSGTAIGDLFPSLAPLYDSMQFSNVEDLVGDLSSGSLRADVVFLALPHGMSQQIVPRIHSHVRLVVDLAADFRLRDASQYPRWYHADHLSPQFLERAVYGLPELTRSELKGAELIASAGCYVTCSTLAIKPLLDAGLAQKDNIIIDAASGVSGAGRSLKADLLFGEVNEGFSAYGLKSHRHTPEIEQNLGAQVLFTPHLAPMNRGILATAYLRPSAKFNELLAAAGGSETAGCAAVSSALGEAYADEPFVFACDAPPSTRATLGSNNALVHATYDGRTGTIIALGALDNLVKGASGQAVQCANIALGVPETDGLGCPAIFP